MTFADLAEIIRREIGPQAERVLAAICQEAAGEQVYIPQRAAPPKILPSETPAQIQARHGVSRRTAYNWVQRWRG